jgi:L,D-peptidoglycan transpeptidase YkuD (ErfK/YbiS/YcfS/YnhG family)
MLRRYERVGSDWRSVGGLWRVTIGKNGAAWGVGLHPPQERGPQKREGDGRSPAGVFEVGEGFGYAPATSTGLTYLPMVKESWCVDVPESPLYNRIVDTRQVGEDAVKGSSEPMRRDLQEKPDDAYRLGFVVRHNPKGTPNGGSCIFVHQQRELGRPTAGCTALRPEELDELFAWLDAKKRPVFVLLPQEEYELRLEVWQLPTGDHP